MNRVGVNPLRDPLGTGVSLTPWGRGCLTQYKKMKGRSKSSVPAGELEIKEFSKKKKKK